MPLAPEQLGGVQDGEMVLARLVAADADDQRELPVTSFSFARARAAASTVPASEGSRIGSMSGPFRPTPASISRQPRYSTAAASEIVATRSMWLTATSVRENAALMPMCAVSAVVRARSRSRWSRWRCR
ncbi:hypothetical protein Q0F99_01165 [Rathayibacter oskolensis]|uniref:hypothetical protein n=1 Tax=Rathayibacter oskolensis TaxID=1891671 RepID=UPI00265DC747|nr:hypothetical protein [Rathayibacter oskolensis]WKK73438.1 hypothetical protein Q0F99_01165 [Rathayibacter oskolensis]